MHHTFAKVRQTDLQIFKVSRWYNTSELYTEQYGHSVTTWHGQHIDMTNDRTQVIDKIYIFHTDNIMWTGKWQYDDAEIDEVDV
jgi:hypothetical protein